MAIYRGQLDADRYTVVPNHWLRDPGISYKAKGVLAYIASHRADYALTVEQMQRETADGRDAIRAALRELERAGYLRRRQSRGGRGRWTPYDYEVVEYPARPAQTRKTAGHTGDGKSGAGSSGDGKSDTEKDHGENPPPPSPPSEAPAPSGADVPEEEAEEAAPEETHTPDPDPVRVDADAPAEPATEPEPAEGEHQAAAAELVAEVPGLRATARRDLTARAARCLALGHGRRVVADECTRDLSGVRSPAAVVRHRLDALAAAAPIPDAPEPAAATTSTATTSAPAERCGQCTGAYQRETPDGLPYPCPQCHPDPGRRGDGARVEAQHGTSGAPAPAPAPRDPEPAPAESGRCSRHGVRECDHCRAALKRAQGRREASATMATLGGVVADIGASD